MSDVNYELAINVHHHVFHWSIRPEELLNKLQTNTVLYLPNLEVSTHMYIDSQVGWMLTGL